MKIYFFRLYKAWLGYDTDAVFVYVLVIRRQVETKPVVHYGSVENRKIKSSNWVYCEFFYVPCFRIFRIQWRIWFVFVEDVLKNGDAFAQEISVVVENGNLFLGIFLKLSDD